MMSEKVLITYKRKRLLAGADPANVKAEASAKTEEEHCSACGCVNVNDNLLVCRSCSGSYHLRCIDTLAEDLPEERWLCVACTKRCDIEVSRQNESHSGKIIDNKIVGESSMVSMQNPLTVLLNSRSSEGKCLERRPFPIDPTIKNTNTVVSSSNMDTDFGSVCGVLEETSRCQSANLETEGRTSAINLDSQSERNTVSRFLEDCVFLVGGSDKRNDLMLQDDIPKEKANTSLITFHRRVKKKPSVAAGPITKNERVEDQHSSMVAASSHEIGDSCCTCEGSTALIEAAGPSRLPIIQQDMHNVKELAGLDGMLAGQGPTDEHKKQCLQSSYDTSQNANPLQSSEHGLQCQLYKSVAPPTSDAAKDPALLLISKLSGMVSNDTSMREEKGNKLVSAERGFDVVIRENLVESQSSSSQNIAPVTVNEETDGNAKSSQLPEKLDNILKEPEEGTITFSQMDKCRTNCRIVTNESTPFGNAINLSANVLLNQADMSKESTNCISTLDERIVVNNSTCGNKQHNWASNNSMYTDFLELSSRLDSEMHEVSVDGLQSIPLDLCLRDTVERYISQPREDSKGEVSTVSQEKLVHDNGLIGLQLLKGRTLFDNLQRFSPEWSEEELDCLWIGVRRHGLRNWSNILTDPKLCFSESRVAEDLAVQWDREQIKLLSGTLSQPVRARSNLSVPHETAVSFWANKASGSLCNEKVVSSYMEFPMQRLETKLSLGGVYAQSEKNAKRNLPYLSDLSVHNSLAPKSSTANPFLASNLIGFTNPWAGTQHHNTVKKRYARYDCESSTSPQKSFENVVPEQRSAYSSLPHWLKEVFSMPQRQNSLPLSSGVASLNSASMVNTDERVALFSSVGDLPVSPKDSRGRGILKRKSVVYRENAADVKTSENSVSLENPSLRKRFSLLPDLGLTLKPTSIDRCSGPSEKILDLNNMTSDPIGPSDLVVIDSDASSEETISDDQGNRR